MKKIKISKEDYKELTKLVNDKKLQNPNFFKVFRIGGLGNYEEVSEKLHKGRINHKVQLKI